jgi:NAD(P)-dependent dehydrogenase (short-subunit alcohol dehydrogenase family)
MPVVVITGASAGVGRATVQAFARRGARLALLARGEERLEEAAREAERLGSPQALAIPPDVAEHSQVEEAAARAERELGPIDVWVNNAMATIFARLRDIEPEEFEQSTRTTYLGTVWGTMAALRRMLPRDRGTVVQVGSALAYRGIPLQAPYCGAKHGTKGFVESLRTELRHDGSNVHVCSVHLPALNTPQFEWGRSKMPRHPQPVPPIFQPEVAAEAIVWMSERRKRELLVGWPTVKVVWGNKLAPWFVEWFLARSGFDGQQTDEETGPRDGNLFAPVGGDWGAHGSFDDEAKPSSLQAAISLRLNALVHRRTS